MKPQQQRFCRFHYKVTSKSLKVYSKIKEEKLSKNTANRIDESIVYNQSKRNSVQLRFAGTDSRGNFKIELKIETFFRRFFAPLESHKTHYKYFNNIVLKMFAGIEIDGPWHECNIRIHFSNKNIRIKCSIEKKTRKKYWNGKNENCFFFSLKCDSVEKKKVNRVHASTLFPILILLFFCNNCTLFRCSFPFCIIFFQLRFEHDWIRRKWISHPSTTYTRVHRNKSAKHRKQTEFDRKWRNVCECHWRVVFLFVSLFLSFGRRQLNFHIFFNWNKCYWNSFCVPLNCFLFIFLSSLPFILISFSFSSLFFSVSFLLCS